MGELFQHNGRYRYSNGFNSIAIIALLLGILPNVPGFLTATAIISKEAVWPWLAEIYNYAWFVGFLVSGFTYFILMKRRKVNDADSIKYKETPYHVSTH